MRFFVEPNTKTRPKEVLVHGQKANCTNIEKENWLESEGDYNLLSISKCIGQSINNIFRLNETRSGKEKKKLKMHVRKYLNVNTCVPPAGCHFKN